MKNNESLKNIKKIKNENYDQIKLIKKCEIDIKKKQEALEKVTENLQNKNKKTIKIDKKEENKIDEEIKNAFEDNKGKNREVNVIIKMFDGIIEQKDEIINDLKKQLITFFAQNN